MYKRFISLFVCLIFAISNIPFVQAQSVETPFMASHTSPFMASHTSPFMASLPEPGTMVGESAPFSPLTLKGLVIDRKKPLEFQFIVDTGRGLQDRVSVKQQVNQLVKYFLAGLTIPQGDLWVNLSPYEKDRIIPEALGQTDLGRDLLAQDYILKQLTASLIYPEKDLGKEFWAKVYAKAQKQYGTTDVPVNTFNKVWILPDQAQVYTNNHAAYVTKSTLKVMLEQDYLSIEKHAVETPFMASHTSPFMASLNKDAINRVSTNNVNALGSQIVRQIILPEIEKEVNTGKNFAPLRQIYQALILAKWYRQTIQNSLLDAVYTNKNKIAGVNLSDPTLKEQIYERYLKAYKKGAFNYIKDDPTPNGQFVPRKYFSGGITEMGEFPLDEHGSLNNIPPANSAMAAINIRLLKSSDNSMDSQVPANGIIKLPAGFFPEQSAGKINEDPNLPKINIQFKYAPADKSITRFENGGHFVTTTNKPIQAKIGKRTPKQINGPKASPAMLIGLIYVMWDVEKLTGMLTHQESKVRVAALDRINAVEKDPAKKLLIFNAALDNSSDLVRQSAMKLIDDLQIDHQEKLKVYHKALTNPDHLVKQWAKDRAMSNPLDTGGIDLNQIKVDQSGKKLNVDFDQAQLNELLEGGFEGFRPVITKYTIIQSPLPLLR